MNRTRIKICGLTRDEDVKFAVGQGADAIGFVFARSPRRVSPVVAARLAGHVPASVLRVGLFLDQDRSEIEHVLNTVPLDLLQFHGREDAGQCSAFDLPWLKAVAMADEGALERAERDYAAATGLLLDSHTAGQQGGSGEVFNWSLARQAAIPIWLAGGLHAANVGQAIRKVQPYAVDVSSGVETAPGIKDVKKISAFIRAVEDAGR